MYEWRGYGGGGSPSFECSRLSDHQKTNFTGYENRRRRLRDPWCSPINPNKPRILPKTSTMRILTNRFGSAASAMAAVEPVIPTQIPQSRLHAPTVTPPQKTAKPYGRVVSQEYDAGRMRWKRACEVIIASVHPGVRNRSQFGRVDNANDLGRHGEGIAGIGNITGCAQHHKSRQLRRK